MRVYLESRVRSSLSQIAPSELAREIYESLHASPHTVQQGSCSFVFHTGRRIYYILIALRSAVYTLYTCMRGDETLEK